MSLNDQLKDAYIFLTEKFPSKIKFSFNEIVIQDLGMEDIYASKNHEFTLGNISDINNLRNIYRSRENYCTSEEDSVNLKKFNEFLSMGNISQDILWMSTIVNSDNTFNTIFFNLTGDFFYFTDFIDRDKYLSECSEIDLSIKDLKT